MDKRIGAQYYTIRDFCQTLDDFDKSCEKIKNIGYKTVQLSGIGDFDGNDVKKILDKYALEALCTHRLQSNYLENIEGEIEYHKAIDCSIAGIGAMPGLNGKLETVDSFIKNYNPVCEALAKHNIMFAYHNHAFEFEKPDGEYVIDKILSGIKADNFKIIFDTYWAAFAGINPADFIKKHKGRIACAHFKDLRIVDNTQKFAEVGCGNLNWDEIIDACETYGVEYAIVEQDTCDGDPFDCLERSYKFLTGKGFE